MGRKPGYTHFEETKNKMREAQIGTKGAIKGQPKSGEHKKNK